MVNEYNGNWATGFVSWQFAHLRIFQKVAEKERSAGYVTTERTQQGGPIWFGEGSLWPETMCDVAVTGYEKKRGRC